MSDLPEMFKKLKFDKRMTNWNLRQKLLTETEYAEHLKSLKDISDLKAEDLVQEEEEEEEEVSK